MRKPLLSAILLPFHTPVTTGSGHWYLSYVDPFRLLSLDKRRIIFHYYILAWVIINGQQASSPCRDPLFPNVLSALLEIEGSKAFVSALGFNLGALCSSINYDVCKSVATLCSLSLSRVDFPCHDSHTENSHNGPTRNVNFKPTLWLKWTNICKQSTRCKLFWQPLSC
jgi:hypothetical protein